MASPSEAVEATLSELRKRREQIDRAIEALEAVSSFVDLPSGSISAAVGIAESKSSANAKAVDASDLMKLIYEGQFFNKSQTQAAKELLNLVKRPLKTPVLSEALTKSGMKVYTPSLYTTFKRSPDFVLVLPNTWGLKEWYPGGIKSSKPEKKSKRRERKKKTSKPVSEAESSGDQPKKRGRPRKTVEGVP
jgi:hypothetical protein